MEKIRKYVFIEAPPAKIFGYLTEAAHLTEIWPCLVEVSNVQCPDQAGRRA